MSTDRVGYIRIKIIFNGYYPENKISTDNIRIRVKNTEYYTDKTNPDVFCPALFPPCKESVTA
jgi:hypothetical protein